MGKTVAVLNDLIIGALECKNPNPQFAYIAPNYQQAKRVAWEYLKFFAGPLIKQSHESELRVTLVNGAKIYLLGAEKADSLRGMYLDGCALDEFAQIRPSAVSQVILPCLSDRQGWAVFMGTPKGKNHFYDYYKRAKEDPSWYHMTARASDTLIVPQEELTTMRLQMDDSDYQQEFECSFEAALKGAIYGKEMEQAEALGRIAEFNLDKDLPVDCVADLGFADDTVLTFFQHSHSHILIHEIYTNNEMNWDHYLDELDDRHVRDIYLPHDARAKNLQTGRSIVEQTIKRGYTPKIVTDHKLRDGIQSTRKLLPYIFWNRSLCAHGIEAMKSYRREWDDKAYCYRERPVHDWSSHVADCIRYLAMTFSRLAETKIIVPNEARGVHYAFTLEDLFSNWRTNPGLNREQ